MIYILIYLVGAFLAYGLSFGTIQKMVPDLAEQEYKSDRRISILLAVGSWITVMAIIIIGVVTTRNNISIGFKIK